jgi:hypothetical protein
LAPFRFVHFLVILSEAKNPVWDENKGDPSLTLRMTESTHSFNMLKDNIREIPLSMQIGEKF